jgi:hypothetical protein
MGVLLCMCLLQTDIYNPKRNILGQSWVIAQEKKKRKLWWLIWRYSTFCPEAEQNSTEHCLAVVGAGMFARLEFGPGHFRRCSKQAKWLEDWKIVFRFLPVIRGFYIFHNIQTVIGAHLNSYPLAIGASFFGVEWPADKLLTHLCRLQMF